MENLRSREDLPKQSKMMGETVLNSLSSYANFYRSLHTYLEAVQSLEESRKETDKRHLIQGFFNLKMLTDQKTDLLLAVLHKMKWQMNEAVSEEVQLNRIELAKFLALASSKSSTHPRSAYPMKGNELPSALLSVSATGIMKHDNSRKQKEPPAPPLLLVPRMKKKK